MVLRSHPKSTLQWSDEGWSGIHQLHLSPCSHLRVTSWARSSIIITENMPKNIQIGWGSQEVAQYPQHMKNLLLPTPPLRGRLNSITKVLWSPEIIQWMAGSRKDLSKTYSCPLEQCSFLSSPNYKSSLLTTHDTSQLGIPGRNKIAKHYVDQVGGTQARK